MSVSFAALAKEKAAAAEVLFPRLGWVADLR
jgi:hypothetical protein